MEENLGMITKVELSKQLVGLLAKPNTRRIIVVLWKDNSHNIQIHHLFEVTTSISPDFKYNKNPLIAKDTKLAAFMRWNVAYLFVLAAELSNPKITIEEHE